MKTRYSYVLGLNLVVLCILLRLVGYVKLSYANAVFLLYLNDVSIFNSFYRAPAY